MGRPPKYKPEYCQQIIDHCAGGLSIESFAGVIDVNKDTLYEWVKEKEDFAEAKAIADAKCLLFYEKVGLKGMVGKLPGFNVTAWIFTMKNKFKWRDGGEENSRTPVNVVFNYDPNGVDDGVETATEST